MHQMHQCTDSGAPDQVHFIGKFHLKVPDLDLLYPVQPLFRHQWSMTTRLIAIVIALIIIHIHV